MAKISRQAYDNFYKNKTIMRNNLFSVDIPNLYKSSSLPLYTKFKDYTKGFLKNVSADNFVLDWNFVKSVNLPDLSFDKSNGVKVGPVYKATPTLNFDGYELQLELEDDEKGTVRQLIEHFKSRNISDAGLYWPTNFSEISQLNIKVYNGLLKSPNEMIPVIEVTLKDLIFLQASEVSLNYSEQGSISYTVTLSAASIETKYYK